MVKCTNVVAGKETEESQLPPAKRTNGANQPESCWASSLANRNVYALDVLFFFGRPSLSPSFQLPSLTLTRVASAGDSITAFHCAQHRWNWQTWNDATSRSVTD